ncbi:hypothetical protein [Candidatus Marithrix sp. Canyon 246]|uniref:hypothetical protein n=1 Tax=Candidatus Marithrix sp. Canyon 246 TaxID=1827136 RepID=UPI00084A0163|nr:hypothetical protein [Candidatus Marithrix sp. Canyon 246]
MKLIITLIIPVLLGCNSTPTKSKIELENIRFIDTEIFDKDLIQSMKANSETITISIIGNISINNIPERLGKWLSIVMDKQGKVDFKINERTTGVEPLSLLMGVAPTAYKFLKKEASYGLAGNYNVTVFYIYDNGIITKIIFTKKQ